ncbi:ubiquitin fusion degradation protein 1 [Pelomyxa schiedti]|nr:ubiquitin fusion degradation protein 1 [Pelomyxa schiedti]
MLDRMKVSPRNPICALRLVLRTRPCSGAAVHNNSWETYAACSPPWLTEMAAMGRTKFRLRKRQNIPGTCNRHESSELVNRELQRDLRRTTEDLGNTLTKLHDFKSELRDMTIVLNSKHNLESEYYTLHSKYYGLLSEHYELQSKLIMLQSAHNRLQSEHNELDAKHNMLRSEYDKLEDKHKKQKKVVKKCRSIQRHARLLTVMRFAVIIEIFVLTLRGEKKYLPPISRIGNEWGEEQDKMSGGGTWADRARPAVPTAANRRFPGGDGWLFRAYSLAVANRQDLEASDKILMPPEALARLQHTLSNSAVIFDISNPVTTLRAACSVSEFTAEKEQVCLPYWLMEYLGVIEGGFISLRQVTLPKGSFVRFRPVDKSFYTLQDPKAELESFLRKFSTLTNGTTLFMPVPSGEKIGIVVDCLKPSERVSIINVDIDTDFAPMAGVENCTKTDTSLPTQIPTPPPDSNMECSTTTSTSDSQPSVVDETSESPTSTISNEKKFVAFMGEGHTPSGPSADQESVICSNCKNSIPKAQYPLHQIRCERLNRICSMCGCKILRAQEKEHMESFHGPVTCKCGEVLDKYFLPSHELDECTHRLIGCPFCKIQVQQKDIAEHKDYCGSRSERCPKCNKLVIIRELSKHVCKVPSPSPSPGRPSMTLQDHFPPLDFPMLSPQTPPHYMLPLKRATAQRSPKHQPDPIVIDDDEYICPECGQSVAITSVDIHATVCTHNKRHPTPTRRHSSSTTSISRPSQGILCRQCNRLIDEADAQAHFDGHDSL